LGNGYLPKDADHKIIKDMSWVTHRLSAPDNMGKPLYFAMVIVHHYYSVDRIVFARPSFLPRSRKPHRDAVEDRASWIRVAEEEHIAAAGNVNLVGNGGPDRGAGQNSALC